MRQTTLPTERDSVLARTGHFREDGANMTIGTFSNSYSRRRRRLRPIKTGVESAFFPPK